MANRDNHYEAAFEEYLRRRGVPYVAVDEARRSVLSNGASIKSLDFIVSAAVRWLVNVKGRKFPSGDVQKQYWKNWSTRDDLLSLAQWERLFGQGFCGLFVFAYNILGDRPRCRTSSFSPFATGPMPSLPCGWPTTPGTLGRSRSSGTRWPCRPPTSAASPGRWMNCWACRARERKGTRNDAGASTTGDHHHRKAAKAQPPAPSRII